MLGFRAAEADDLKKIHEYLKGEQRHPMHRASVPSEMTEIVKLARVNMMDIVVSALAQSMYVDGYRAPNGSSEAKAWEVWQLNRMDAWQTGVHRSALAYGGSYVVVTPGELRGQKTAVIRGKSPRRMTALYEEETSEWPIMALEAIPSSDKWAYRLYDERSIHFFGADADQGNLTFLESRDHNLGVVPVVRFLNTRDLDEDNFGEVEPLMDLQDQIDATTFNLLVAQFYGAFKQRYVIGWLAPDESERLKASISNLWTFEDNPDDVKVGEFAETSLTGYLESREASLRHAATISQTPVHELLGQLVNLSAEALVAAEAGQRRKISERQVSFGESWEQVLLLAGRIAGFEADPLAQVRWRDTESRALSATVDALGKMATMLGVPPQVLWERIPGVTQQDVEKWNTELEKGDALGNLAALLDRQMGSGKEDPEGAVV
jgi:hypothetical protein